MVHVPYEKHYRLPRNIHEVRSRQWPTGPSSLAVVSPVAKLGFEIPQQICGKPQVASGGLNGERSFGLHPVCTTTNQIIIYFVPMAPPERVSARTVVSSSGRVRRLADP